VVGAAARAQGGAAAEAVGGDLISYLV